MTVRGGRWYLAGPMSGHPFFNIPAFTTAALRLREKGWDIVTPVELDDDEVHLQARLSIDGDPEAFSKLTGLTWGDFLSRDIKVVADECDGVIVLPGWAASRGARLEVSVAHGGGKPVLVYRDGIVADAPALTDALEASQDRLRNWTDFPGAFKRTPAGHGGKGYSEESFDDPDFQPTPLQVFSPMTPPDGLERLDAFVASKTRYLPGAASGGFYTATLPAEQRVVNETTGGEKGAKQEAFHLLPPAALAEVARVYAMGAKKYSPWNWRKGYDWSLSYAAMQRHLNAWWDGEDSDPESGLSHVAHAAFHCLALITFASEHPELDDRFAA